MGQRLIQLEYSNLFHPDTITDNFGLNQITSDYHVTILMNSVIDSINHYYNKNANWRALIDQEVIIEEYQYVYMMHRLKTLLSPQLKLRDWDGGKITLHQMDTRLLTIAFNTRKP